MTPHLENFGENHPPSKKRGKIQLFPKKVGKSFPEKISTFSKFHNFLTRRSRALKTIYVIAMV